MTPGQGDPALCSESGETAVSAVVGIVLVTVALISLSIVVSSNSGILRSVRSAVTTKAELARFDALLLTAAGRVIQPLALPLSESVPSVTALPSVELAFVDAESAKVLRLYQAGELVLQVSDERHHFTSLTLISIDVAALPIPHLLVVVRDDTGRESSIAAPIGQLPLRMVPELAAP